MIPIFLMIIGAIMILVSVFMCLMYLFEPLYKNYQIVIKRKDDYAHYTSPSNFALLQKARKGYWIQTGILFIIGCILFFTGAYLKYGEKGFGLLFSTELEESEDSDSINQELAEGFDSSGNYISDDGLVYTDYVIVKGTDILFKDKSVCNLEEFETEVERLPEGNTIYVIDGYASAHTFHEVMRILSEKGFEYETDE
ncbi:hypothetical protein [Butyrivibrio sp. AE3004]|uniref:hypothetical protein n=1 Tax=Butyrivibrio sp. AE3004 TaxID=1506994 RepID=UPI0004946238|nr:hypothetical protein [Butyrivibrio sp. AE3004]